MKNIIYFLERFQRRSLLIAAAALLAIVNLASWVGDAYDTRQVEVESKLAQLSQSRLVTSKTKILDKRQKNLLRQKEQVGRYFFTGEDSDKISSAMQLRIQALVAKAGMRAESIRSTPQKTEGKQDGLGGGYSLDGVLIKARLAGTLAEFLGFMAELYKGKEFFEIKSISLKPYRNVGLKILIELKGYYVLLDQDNNSGED